MKNKSLKYFALALVVILLDQGIKLYVHATIEMGIRGQIKVIGNWFKIHYVLNPGMAFGIQIGHEYGKLFLTVFRIAAIFLISRYLLKLANKESASSSLLWGLALVLGGAVGNGIDSAFYGVLLNNAPYNAPTPWFYGQVIDMFYIDIWEGFLPRWIPLIGGDFISLWPIFNLADTAIFIGVAIILIWRKRTTPIHPKDKMLTHEAEPGLNDTLK
ncbi:MAG: lipoprotein signal peptidase [Cytophagales bacterium]|nr:lipoprotein signal peptidase [Cytophagales bacterium]